MAAATIHEVQSKRQGLIYRIRYDYVDPASGKRVRPWETLPPGTSRRQAEVAKRRGLAALDAARLPVATDATVGALLGDWLATDIRGRLELTTVEGYESTVRAHLVPAFGQLPLRKLTPAFAQRWEVDYRKGHGYRTVQLCHLRLKQACAYGVRMGLLAANPLLDVRPPATQARPRHTWSAAEVAIFLRAAEDCPYYPLWHFLLGTGVRRGEALGLRWADLDWAEGTVRIEQTIRPLHGSIYKKPPKNPQSGRSIPLHAGLLERLERHLQAQHERRRRLDTAWTEHDLVFASAVGTPINPNNITRAFLRLLERSRVRRITVHQLRHTVGTLALANGAQLEEIRQLLGHKKISTTADIYAQVRQPALRDVVEAVWRATEGDGLQNGLQTEKPPHA